jgi:hypothetical protein
MRYERIKGGTEKCYATYTNMHTKHQAKLGYYSDSDKAEQQPYTSLTA